MRVLLVSNLDSTAPTGRFLRPFHLGRGLRAAGVEVADVGVDCVAVEGPSWSAGRKSLLPLARATRRAVVAFRPDVIYAHEMRPALAAMLVAPGVPVVVDYHSIPSYEWAGYARTSSGPRSLVFFAAAVRVFAMERLAARRAAALVAAGPEVAEDLVRWHGVAHVPVVVPNAVGDELLARERPAASPYQPGQPAVLAMIPAAETEANARALRFLVSVAGRLARADPPVTVHVVGTERDEPSPVRYHGFVDDILPWVAHADACLLPYPREAALRGGARLKLLECLAAGRAVVTTPEGLRGLREAAGWPGVTQADARPEAFAAAVSRAVAPGAPRLDETREELRRRLAWSEGVARVREVLAGAASARRG